MSDGDKFYGKIESRERGEGDHLLVKSSVHCLYLNFSSAFDYHSVFSLGAKTPFSLGLSPICL